MPPAAAAAASADIQVAVQTARIDIAAAYAALVASDRDAHSGAACCFVGRVRGGEVRAMTLEHYPDMTQRALRDILRAAAVRWPLAAAHVIHRVGRLLPGEEIVFVGASSAHRAAAAAACAFITDYLKTDAPFWKKEETAHGARWVTARREDDAARRRWQADAAAAKPAHE